MLLRAAREGDPDLQLVPLSTLPVRREPGMESRLHSGSTGTLRSPTRNRVPVTMVDFKLAPDAAATQDLPGPYTAFLYAIDGSVRIGDDVLAAGDIGWLDRPMQDATHLRVAAGAAGARVVLYAGQPQNEPIVQRGPFVAGSQSEIGGYYAAYRAGSFPGLGAITGRTRVSSAA